MRFSKQFRLLKPEQFQRVFKQAIRSGDRCFRVLARANSLPHCRLGLAVSKKNCKLAVGRNRIKRVVRESFRTHLAGQLPTCALDVVVLPTALATTFKNADLEYSLALHWQKLSAKMMNQKTGMDNGQNDRTRPIEDRGQ